MPDASTNGSAPERTSKVSLLNILWPVLLSLAALAAISHFTFDLATFRQLLPRLNPWLLAAALATVALRVFFGGWRLNYFARGRLGLRGGIRSQLAWDFFAYVTPSVIGGGPFVAVFLARDRDLPLGQATSIILFSMLVDQVWFALTMPVLLVCAMYVDVFPTSLGVVGYWSIVLFFVGFMAWVLLFAYSTLFRPQLLAGLVGRLFGMRWLRRFRARVLAVMDDLEHRSAVLRTQRPAFYLRGFVLTLLPWISRYLLVLLVIWSVYPSADRLLVFLRSTAMNLGSLAMPTPGGAGGVEGLYVLFFGPPLLPQSLVAPTLLAWRLLSYYLFIIVGVFVTARHVQNKTAQRTVPPHANPAGPPQPRTP
ncbi:MAG: lysylphosphatidylglycerol synthase transmembrane domain-containing protein [Rhodothermales bacterium]